MRLALISDIHGNIDALNAVLADIARRGVSDIVNLGDCLSGPLDAVATAERLMALGLPTIQGNHDRQLYDRPAADMGSWEKWIINDLSDSFLAWVKGFPATITRDDMLFCHATPDQDDENWLDRRGPDNRLVARDIDGVIERLGAARQSLIACGHTHSPRIVRLPNGPTIVNPGAVGCPAYIDDRTDPPFIQQTGSPDARYAVVERADAGWHIDLISVPYDTSRMAALARTKGAESWAHALETGWWA